MPPILCFEILLSKYIVILELSLHNYCVHHINDFDIWKYIMDFYILDDNFIKFLSYIDCREIIMIRNNMCHFLYQQLYIMEAKYSRFLWKERGNILENVRCNAMIIWHFYSKLIIESISFVLIRFISYQIIEISICVLYRNTII